MGMKALVSLIRNDDGYLEALSVAAAEPGELPGISRFNGTITAVSVDDRSISMQTQEGDDVRFMVGDLTRYRSSDGSVDGLEDLQSEMTAVVTAVERQGEAPMALLVVVRTSAERLQRIRVIGDITSVDPGQGTFALNNQEGRNLTFSVSDRTKFRSRDGSIESLQDLKAGMHAAVIAVEEGEDSLTALVVAAGSIDGQPATPQVDVRVMGRITALGDRTFTIETKEQGSLTFSVDGATIYRSRDGSANGFDDLEVGMLAVVGARRLENGDLKAVFIGIGKPRTQQPLSEAGEHSDRMQLVNPE
jgi:hypothetical protein